MKLLIPRYPTQVYHEITCYHNYEGGKVEEADLDEDWVGFRREGKGQRDGGE